MTYSGVADVLVTLLHERRPHSIVQLRIEGNMNQATRRLIALVVGEEAGVETTLQIFQRISLWTM